MHKLLAKGKTRYGSWRKNKGEDTKNYVKRIFEPLQGEKRGLILVYNLTEEEKKNPGKVIRMTEPFLEYCPLADSLYDNVKGIRKIVEEKIAKFGHFTAKRKLYREDVAIPYGASEMMMYVLAIPVFVLTEKGLDFITSYSSSEKVFKNLDAERQYLISGRYKGTKVRMGDFNIYLSEAELPVRSEKEPRPLT